jgi:hypothetical protein
MRRNLLYFLYSQFCSAAILLHLINEGLQNRQEML